MATEKHVVLGKAAGRTVSKNKKKFFDTQDEATAHAKSLIAAAYRENPGTPHITLYTAKITGVVEVGAPNITTREVGDADVETMESDED